jgi:hypothetical protein
MKNINKILAIVLTVALLAGLMMLAVPVSASTNSWAIVSQPKVTAGTDANVYAISADGKTMYLYSNSTDLKLYKSTDSGYTWSDTSMDTGNKLTGLTLTKIVVSQFDATELAATDGTDLFRSTNSGQTWQNYTPGSVTTPINDIAISEGDSGGVAYLVGAADGVWLYDSDADGIWVNLDSAGFSGNASAVAFSPNYSNDTAIIGFDSAALVLKGLEYGSAKTWNSDILDSAAFPVGAVLCSLALPSNYDPNSTSYNKVLVGLGDVAGTDIGVYRVNGKSTGTTSTVTALDTGINVFSLAYKGTASSGTLAIGQYDSTDVLTSTAVMSGDTPDWTSSGDNMSSPTGPAAAAQTKVEFSPAAAVLFAGTAGADNALSMSTDYASFAQIAFINVSSLAAGHVSLGKLKMADAKNWFVFLTDDVLADDPPVGAGTTADDSYRLFATTDAGTTWKQVRNNGNISMDSVNFDSSYATDKTIYIIQVGAGGAQDNNAKKLLKSSDGGATWAKVATPGNVMATGMAVLDASTYWMGSTDGIRLSTSSVTADLEGQYPLVMIPIPGFFLVATGEGSLYMSTDNGATFDRLGDKAQFWSGAPVMVPPNFAIDPPTKTVYAVENASQNVLKWVVGTDSSWSTEIKFSDLPASVQTFGISNLDLKAGIWYIISIGNTTGQIWRSFDDTETTDAGFSYVPASAGIGAVGHGPLDMAFGADGNATYYPIVTRTTAPTGEYKDTIKVYTDALISPVTTNAPAANAVENNTQVTTAGTSTLVDLSWNAVSSAKTYEWQIANDSAFKNVQSTAITSALSVSQIPLVPGRTYYWRVRVYTNALSKWSTGVQFTTATTSSTSQGIDQQYRIYPAQGEVITGTTITFTWGSVPTADTYEIAISKNGTQVDTQTGLTTTTYTYSKLETGAQYTWAVRAVSGGLPGNWVTSAFTTAIPPASTSAAVTASSGAAVTPTYTVIVPTQSAPIVNVAPATGTTTAPATPPYVWVIIVIGAILVIAVIVLIVRTRRV